MDHYKEIPTLQIESPQKSVGGSFPSPDQPPPAEDQQEVESIQEEPVKSKETPHQQDKFDFDIGSPQSLKDFQERAL